VLKDATVTINVISDSSKLLEMEGAWNKFIKNCSENPFLLSGFIKQFMEFNCSKGWVPLVLVITAENKIVGISPLKMKKKLGIKIVEFLPNSLLSPDFIINNKYREICIANILEFLFRTLKCQFINLTLPANSHNLRIIEQKCKDSKIHFCTKPEMGCRIIPVERTWSEFESFRGSNFRRKFKKIERNLDRVGSWRIACVEGGKEEPSVIGKILDIERMSWKEGHRIQRRVKMDRDLMMIWNASQYTAKTEPNFAWSVWFLELNDRRLAYILTSQYKDVAYFVKTSYDERYRRFYPGIYVMNAAIREFFNRRQIRKIDFLSDLSFHETWTPLCLPRLRIIMSRNRVLTFLIRSALLSRPTKYILASLSKVVPFVTDLIS
jgi:hypothetical protein